MITPSMITIDIPGYKTIDIKHLVMDYNGTLACDGRLIPGIKKILDILHLSIKIHVITADTFGRAAAELEGVPARLSILPQTDQDKAKLAYINNLGAEGVMAVGNGRNDKLMLEQAALGVALIQEEGSCVKTIMAADMVCPDIISALALLTSPQRLIAGLRR